MPVELRLPNRLTLSVVIRLLTGVFVAVLFSASSAFAGDKYDCLDAYNGQNYTEALRLCRPLAEQGEFAAQNVLGLMYLKGRGVSQNDFEAAKWFRKAAEQGDPWSPSAQSVLGTLYEDGHGVPQDYVLAYMWYNLGGAEAARDYLATKMTPDQIAEAQRLTREWKPTK
jgi:TPR repeat protein